MTVDLLVGDCLEVLKTLPDCSVQCCVTSPPYYGLRDYQVEGQIGLEETPEKYVECLIAVFREVKRVLKDDGTLWLNMGDSYAGSGKGGQSEEKRSANWQPDYPQGIDPSKRNGKRWGEGNLPATGNLKPKDLIGIPWSVAFALRTDGWWLRSDIIWAKGSCMPESVTDRPTKSHEYIFLLSKSKKYYYDHIAILEPAAYDGRKDTAFKGSQKLDLGSEINREPRAAGERWPNKVRGFSTKDQLPDNQHHGKNIGYSRMCTNIPGHSGNFNANGEPNMSFDQDGIPARNKRDVWHVNPRAYKEAHFATYPPDLVEPCILAGTSEKGECPKCGKAWKRVVERTPIPRNDNRSHSTEEQRQGKTPAPEPIKGENTSPIVTTVSWQPQCECGFDPVRQTVLDPFNGAGTTGLVAIKHNRNYIGIELNPEYVELTRKRLSDIQPILFEDIK